MHYKNVKKKGGGGWTAKHGHMGSLFLHQVTEKCISFSLTNPSSILELDFQHLHRSCYNNLQKDDAKNNN